MFAAIGRAYDLGRRVMLPIVLVAALRPPFGDRGCEEETTDDEADVDTAADAKTDSDEDDGPSGTSQIAVGGVAHGTPEGEGSPIEDVPLPMPVVSIQVLPVSWPCD